MHQAGRETPLDRMGPRKGEPVRTTWRPCPPGQTRMRYDGTAELGVNPYLDAKLGARETKAGVCPPVQQNQRPTCRGHCPQRYSMLFSLGPFRLFLCRLRPDLTLC